MKLDARDVSCLGGLKTRNMLRWLGMKFSPLGCTVPRDGAMDGLGVSRCTV